MADLKPCPFCGHDGSLSTNVNARIIFCSCWVCGARGSVVQYVDRATDKDIAKAIEAWNRRVGDGK